MPNILIRDVPDSVRAKIRQARQRQTVSRNAYLVSLLSDAVERLDGPGVNDQDDHGNEPVLQDVSLEIPADG